jgi:hypothetical protein
MITLLTSRSVATKTWLPDGTILGFDAGYGYNVASIPVSDLQALSNLLTIIQHNPQLMVIRGQYRGDDHARAVRKINKRTGQMEPGITSDGLARRILENFNDTALPWVMIDIDDYAPPGDIDPVRDPERAIQAYIGANLPPCFYGAGYHWQLSSSAGHSRNAGLLKAHVWFWLDQPRTSAELKAWHYGYDRTGEKIDSSVFNAVQPHYTALPVFSPGVVDPVPRRCGVVPGNVVTLTIDPAVAAAAAMPREHDGRYEVTDPREKPGAIGAFCRAYAIEQLLAGPLKDHFEFERGSEWRLNWIGSRSGTPGGAFITEDRLHVVSKHATDPCKNRKTNLFDLVRVHCFGAADAGCDWMQLANMRTTPSYQHMLDWTMRQEPVVEAVRVSAVKLSGHLATINDAAEQSFAAGLRGLSGLNDPHLWIGLHDPDADGDAGTDGSSSQWVWVSGETSTYRNWGDKEPNQFLGLDEDEVHILNSEHYGGTGTWNDWLPDKSTFDYGTPRGIYGLVEVNMAPVPEPETYAMMLAGLGLIGVMARRRKQKLNA